MVKKFVYFLQDYYGEVHLNHLEKKVNLFGNSADLKVGTTQLRQERQISSYNIIYGNNFTLS